jgi:hypothetical protein
MLAQALLGVEKTDRLEQAVWPAVKQWRYTLLGVCRTYGKVCLSPSFCYRSHFACYSPVRPGSAIRR